MSRLALANPPLPARESQVENRRFGPTLRSGGVRHFFVYLWSIVCTGILFDGRLMRRSLLDHNARPLSSEEGAFEKNLNTFTRNQSQNLVLTVLYVPYSLDSGLVEGG